MDQQELNNKVKLFIAQPVWLSKNTEYKVILWNKQ